MANFFKYPSKSAYEDDTNRPANQASASFDGGEMHYDGKNSLTPIESADGVGIVVTDGSRRYWIRTSDYNASVLDPRFKIVGVMFAKYAGNAVILHPTAPGAMWGQSGFYKITPSASGSFHWAGNINGTAKSGDCSWSSDAVATIVSQINAVQSGLAVNKGTFVGIVVNTYNNSTFTLSSVTGATIEDLSTQVWVDGVKKSEVHRGWQNVEVNSLQLGIVGWNGASSVLYSRAGYNNTYRCGGNYSRWETWASANGNANYVAESAVDIMRQTAFAACASGSADAQAVYNKYNGDYDAYLRAHMVKIDDVHPAGMEYRGYDIALEQTALLAKVMTLDLDGNRVPAFPAAYAAYTATVQTDDAIGAGHWHLPNISDIGRFMDNDTLTLINAAMAKIGGVNISNLEYFWSVQEVNASNAWFYFGYYGIVHSYSKRYSFTVRPVLALKVKS